MDRFLPPEIWFQIFDLISVKDKINCRLVNKRFKCYVDNLRSKRLAIIDYRGIKYMNKKWFYSNEFIDLDDILIGLKEPRYLNGLLKCTFLYIQRLFICFGFQKVDYLSMLNQFVCLKQLDLYEAELILDQHSTLCLPNLQSLSMKKVRIQNQIKLRIDSPKLVALNFDFFKDSFEFVHTDQIIYLELAAFDSFCQNFKNLQYLNVGLIFMDINISTGVFFNFAKLKELNFIGEIGVGGIDPFLFGMIIGFYLRVSADKYKIGRTDLSILINGIPNFNLTYASSFDHYLKLPLNNLRFVRKLNYSELLDYFNHNIPDQLSNNLTGVQTITAEKIENVYQFNEFLFGFKGLNKLQLNFCSDQQIHGFDFLPSLAPKITSLSINFETNRLINLKFIHKFKFLAKLKIGNNIELNFVNLSFEKLYFLRIFNFNYHDLACAIDFNMLKLKIDQKEIKFNNNLHELLNYLSSQRFNFI